MCGICGFIRSRNESIQSDVEIIKEMCEILAHRGPDGEGVFIDADVAIGHRRLSLIDLERGSQPMVRDVTDHSIFDSSETSLLANQTVALTFNGEIYNYRELADELAKLGWVFETESDTEVLLAGYVLWGGQLLLRKIKGMFAFAIWDSRYKTFFCARDTFGIKPFYYSVNDNGGFIFASEAKAILHYPGFEKRLNHQAIEQYLCFQFNPLCETFFKNIYKLPAAHFMIVDLNGNVHMERYWRAHFEANNDIEPIEARRAIDKVINDSVRRHAIADVEVGAYLSGGIDSSYIASSLAYLNPSLKTFTVGFSEYDMDKSERNEIEWAEILSEEMHTEQKSDHVSKCEFFNALWKIQYHMDEPSADPAAVPLYYLNKMASNSVKAVISGEGADEVFAGYRLYESPIATKKLRLVPKPVLRAASKAFMKLNLRGANYLKRASSDVSEWYYTNANDKAFTKSDLKTLLRFPFASAAPIQVVAESYQEAKRERLDAVKSMQLVDIEHWLVDDILAKTDKMSMANSIECRVPYLDKDVFEVAAQLPTRLNISSKNTKIALRDAARNVIPDKFAEKQKLGFPVPLDEWLRDSDVFDLVSSYFKSKVALTYFNNAELMKLLHLHRTGKDMGRKIWIIWMFLIWHQVYFPEEWDEQVELTITDCGQT